jgi:hypothetical protein
MTTGRIMEARWRVVGLAVHNCPVRRPIVHRLAAITVTSPAALPSLGYSPIAASQRWKSDEV